MTYIVTAVPAGPMTRKLNEARISGPLRVVPAPYEQSRGFRASSIGSCLRTAGYGQTNAPKTHDLYNVDWQLSADIGTAVHERIGELLVKSGMAVDYCGKPAIEVDLKCSTLPALQPLRESLKFSGHIDGVIRNGQGELGVIDIKTTSAKYMDEAYPYLTGKQQAWAAQTTAYMHFFAMPDGEQARVAWIYQINRENTIQRKLWRIEYQPERWALDLARLQAASDAVQAGELPEPEGHLGSCRFCSFRGHCPAPGRI